MCMKKCTEVNPEILSDESAILKFLDCSILQSAPPEAADGDLEKYMIGSGKDELKGIVVPHVVRMMKRDVTQSPQTEGMENVEFSTKQEEYYRTMLTTNYQFYQSISKGVEEQSLLNNVIQLQKVCKYLYLFWGTEPDSGSLVFFHEKQFKASAELTLLKSMRTSIHKEGHWLKFFQMTKLLLTLKDYLNMEYEPKTFKRVDGSVSIAEHPAAFARFTHFLLSGRTCGLGLNLASADTVISYDSDFDSYTDNKEIDWAHQIGHCTKLLVYILVIHASVKELILLLATKKLTCDQLFVYKSGSPKEVENVLIWRTEELFAGPSTVSGKNGTGDSLSKDVSNINIESKQKRVGGIGVVYEDECTDGNPRNFGDGSAVLKLLDCSILQFAPPEAAELDLEKDMFGSVKSMERIADQLKNKRQLKYLLLWLKMSTHKVLRKVRIMLQVVKIKEMNGSIFGARVVSFQLFYQARRLAFSEVH